MSGKTAIYGTVAALFAIVSLLLVFSWLTLEVDFPAFEYVSGGLARRMVSGGLARRMVPAEPYADIAGSVARFLWEYRAIDLNSQAFVIVAAVICCLAMLKREEVEA
jgi:hypothetical protein